MAFFSPAFSSALLFSRFSSSFFRPFSSTSSPPFSLSLAPERLGLGLGSESGSGSGSARNNIINMTSTTQKATLAAGCFWGVEHIFRKQFGQGKGLLDAKVGYAGGKTAHPTYTVVCSGETGHAESVQITFDPSLVSYRQLLEFFYRMHDPTTANRQGPDVGTQYRSVIFTHNDEQEKVAKDVTEKVGKQWFPGKPIMTQIVPMGDWWDAEDYHQMYLVKNPSGYECPSHFVRSFPPLSE